MPFHSKTLASRWHRFSVTQPVWSCLIASVVILALATGIFYSGALGMLGSMALSGVKGIGYGVLFALDLLYHFNLGHSLIAFWVWGLLTLTCLCLIVSKKLSPKQSFWTHAIAVAGMLGFTSFFLTQVNDRIGQRVVGEWAVGRMVDTQLELLYQINTISCLKIATQPSALPLAEQGILIPTCQFDEDQNPRFSSVPIAQVDLKQLSPCSGRQCLKDWTVHYVSKDRALAFSFANLSERHCKAVAKEVFSPTPYPSNASSWKAPGMKVSINGKPTKNGDPCETGMDNLVTVQLAPSWLAKEPSAAISSLPPLPPARL